MSTQPVRKHHPEVPPELRKPRPVTPKVEKMTFPTDIQFCYVNREVLKHEKLRKKVPVYTIAFKVVDNKIVYGLARKSVLDNFCREEGRKLAFAELMHRLNKTGAETKDLGGEIGAKEIGDYLGLSILAGTDALLHHRFDDATEKATSVSSAVIQNATQSLNVNDCKTALIRDAIIVNNTIFHRKWELPRVK